MQQIKTILITCLCAASATLITACNSGSGGSSAATTPNGNKNYSLTMPALSIFTDQMHNSQVINIGGTPGNVNFTCHLNSVGGATGAGSCNSISDSNRKPALQIYYPGLSFGAAMYTGAQINLPPSPFSDGSAGFQPQGVAVGGSLYSASSFVAMGGNKVATSLYFGAVCDTPGNTCRTNTVWGYLAMPDGVYVPVALISQGKGKGSSAYNELYLIGDTSNANSSSYTCSNSPNGIDCTTYLNHRFHIHLTRSNNLLGDLLIDNLDNATLNSANKSLVEMNQIVGTYKQSCYNYFATLAYMKNQSDYGLLGGFCIKGSDGSVFASSNPLSPLNAPQGFSNNEGELVNEQNEAYW